MKKIIGIFVLLLALVISCDKDEYEAPYDDFSSFLWLTTNGFEDADYVSALNDYVGFRDVSKNAIEHSWSIPSGTRLLNNDFTENDSIYSDFVIGTGPLSSEETLLNVMFVEPGIKEIVLRNVFKDSVTESVQMNGNWIVEKTFTVTVFDDLKPAFQVLKGTDVILSVSETDMPDAADAASWPTVTLEAGEELTYVDMTTTGEPDTRTWSLNGASPASTNAQNATVGYFGLGSYEAGSVNSRRTDAAKPDGEAVKVIPLKINVIPSSQPFVQTGEISEDASEVISLNVSGQIGSLSGEEGNFTVHVVNTAVGFDQNISVQSAVVNPNDATQIDLTLSAPIYNSDVINITYTAGNIVSVDTRVLESFGPVNVEMLRNESIVNQDWAGYETDAITGNPLKKGYCEGYWVGNNNLTFLYYSRTTDASRVNDGVASMKYHSPEGVTTVTLQGSWFTNGTKIPHAISPLPAGTYDVSYMVYLEPGNTTQAFTTIVQGGETTVWDVSTLPRGEWVEISNNIVVADDLVNKKFDLKLDASLNMGVTGEQIMYFDYLTWRPTEPRL